MRSRKQSTEGRRQRAVGGIQQPSAARRRLATQAGFTLLELIITLTIIAILVATTVPVARNMVKREKELELRRSLREMRMAIEAYHRDYPAKVGPLDRKEGDDGYPPDLETLVKGIRPPNSVDTIRYLRRIPKDPFTGQADWGLRSTQDDPGSGSWSGKNVFDVYSKAPGTALDGKTQYKDW